MNKKISEKQLEANRKNAKNDIVSKKHKDKDKELNKREKDALDAWWKREKERVGPPKFKKIKEKTVAPEEENPDILSPQLMETCGSIDFHFSTTLLTQASWTLTGEEAVEKANFIAAFMHGLKPRDEMEGILVTQMAGTHNLIMECLKRSMIPGQYLETANDYTNRAYRLMNIFLKQMEALEKYRGKTTQQKMTVEHVHIHEGGQAVVGHIENRSRGEGDERKK